MFRTSSSLLQASTEDFTTGGIICQQTKGKLKMYSWLYDTFKDTKKMCYQKHTAAYRPIWSPTYMSYI